jgi:predicted membrane protein DUF2142
VYAVSYMNRQITCFVILMAYAALAVVWAMTNPPFAAPDEANHYLRAVGISDGSLVGRRVRDTNPTLDTKQLVWTNQATRSVVIPPGLSPSGFACELSSETKSAACTLTAATNRQTIRANTEVGTYQPLPYLLPAAVVGADHHVGGSLRLARLTMVAIWVAALAVAMWAFWDEQLRLASLTGLVVAVTPMVVFVGASVNGSSLEIISSIAFFASLLRLIRPSPGRPPPTQAWLFAGASGLMLAMSRSPGPIWVVLDATIVVFLAGFKLARSTFRTGGRPAVLAATAVLVGIALNRLWEAAYGPHVTITWLPKLESLQAGRREVQQSLQDLVGRFGYLNVPLPKVVLIAWALLVLMLAWFGVRAADRRGRIAFAVTVAISCFSPIYLFAAVIRNTGFGLQGRDYLPIVALLPLLAFELIRRNPPPPRVVARLFAIVALAAAFMQFIAWWINSRRYAVGSNGPWWFLPHAQWSPPVGWGLWVPIALMGSLTLAACGWSSLTGINRVKSRAPRGDEIIS